MDAVGSLLLLMGLVFVIWFWIVLPAQMAAKRNRSALIWVCISLFFSPLLAILLLLAMGNAGEA